MMFRIIPHDTKHSVNSALKNKNNTTRPYFAIVNVAPDIFSERSNAISYKLQFSGTCWCKKKIISAFNAWFYPSRRNTLRSEHTYRVNDTIQSHTDSETDSVTGRCPDTEGGREQKSTICRFLWGKKIIIIKHTHTHTRQHTLTHTHSY